MKKRREEQQELPHAKRGDNIYKHHIYKKIMADPENPNGEDPENPEEGEEALKEKASDLADQE